MKVAVIGGGAGGFFSAIQVKKNFPQSQVIIFEKSKKVLSKVKISGGGRCNVTNGCDSIPELLKAYPRGGKKLKYVFHEFSNKSTIEWFENEGIPLTTQADNCVFPVSQTSQSFIDCFLKNCATLDIKIQTQTGVKSIQKVNDTFILEFSSDVDNNEFDKVIIATGGSPKLSSYDWLKNLGHSIQTPLPSLFTFNMPNESITELMGVVVQDAIVKIQGEKLSTDGPLLITHWGMSGPAILKSSAYGAMLLADKNYRFNIHVNWVNVTNVEYVKAELNRIKTNEGQKNLSNFRPYLLPERLWHFLLKKLDFKFDFKWNQLSNKMENKLIEALTNDIYSVEGKTTFKEEFVTCGGVDLNEVSMKTMQSKIIPGIYFTGEVLDIDAITGGYNFQAAWSTAFIAGKLKD